MADAFLLFRKRIPFEVRLENNQHWAVTFQTGMKSGYLAIVASPKFKRHGEGKFYILTAGKERDVERDIQLGIRIPSGTPERGLVSAMRRAGVVILLPDRLPPVQG